VVELAVILLLILANGLFAGAEIAILTVRKTRLAELADEGKASAAVLQRLRADPESFLATVQVGITVISAAAAAFGGASLAAPLAAAFEKMGLPAAAAHDIGLGVVVAVVSFLSLVLGELVPKSLAMRSAERYALLVARPLAFIARVSGPMVKLLTFCSNLILRMFGDKTSFTESRLSLDELQSLLEETTSAGELHPKAGDMASRALAMPGLKVDAVMTPRSGVVSLRLGSSRDEMLAALRASAHSRFPVHDGDLEGARGYVLGRDVLLQLVDGQPPALGAILHPAPFVPETAETVEVLRRLQQERAQMAFVVDEQGVLVGVVTPEDLVEEIVGDILHEQERPVKLIEPAGPHAWTLAGSVTVREVNRELGLDLPEDGDYTTMAGYVLSQLGRIPKQGETVELAQEQATIEVLEGTPRKLVRLRLTKRVKPEA